MLLGLVVSHTRGSLVAAGVGEVDNDYTVVAGLIVKLEVVLLAELDNRRLDLCNVVFRVDSLASDTIDKHRS